MNVPAVALSDVKSFREHSAEAGSFPDETGPSPEPDGREEVAGGSRKTDNRNYLLKAKTVDHGDTAS